MRKSGTNRFNLSQSILKELAGPAPKGERHQQAVKVAAALACAGFVDRAIFFQLRSMYDGDVTDTELHEIIRWAASIKESSRENGERKRAPNPPRKEPGAVIARASNWLGGFRCEEADLFSVSPQTPLDNWRLDGSMMLATLYDAEDQINVVVDHSVEPEQPKKAKPCGAGITLRRDDWLRRLRDDGPPQSAAGAWIRMNPVTSGSGANGAFTDADVSAYRFLLVESDFLPPEIQLSMIATLSLPVAAIISSGGRSYHAWIRFEVKDAGSYSRDAGRLFRTLAAYGFDRANANPSRLSRFPGALRRIGAEGDGRQRLLYLNPDAAGNTPIFQRK